MTQMFCSIGLEICGKGTSRRRDTTSGESGPNERSAICAGVLHQVGSSVRYPSNFIVMAETTCAGKERTNAPTTQDEGVGILAPASGTFSQSNQGRNALQAVPKR
jgi:hypothetical protein